MSVSRTIVALSLASAVGEAVRAQPAIAIPAATAGNRMRVESPAIFGIRVVGPLLEANQGFVSIAVSDDAKASIVVPWSMISSIDVAEGRERRSMAARGALVGIAAAFVAGPALWDQDMNTPAFGANLGTIASLALPASGALIGWLAAPPHWKLIDWRPSIDTVLPEGEAIRLRLPEDASVMVRSRRRWIKARAVTTADSLVLRTDAGQRTLPWSDVSELRLRERRDRMRGAALGFTSMALASTLWLQAYPLPRDAKEADFLVVRVLAGGLVGAIIGAPGWKRVPTPIR